MIFFDASVTGGHKRNVGRAVLSLLLASPVGAQTLSLKDYLGQVAAKHDGVSAAAAAERGARQRSEEGEVELSPTAFVEGVKSLDASPKNFPAAEGRRVEYGSVKAGVSKVTDLGVTARAYYQFSRTDLNGADPFFVNPVSFYRASPVAEVSVDLWRNALGRETKAAVSAAREGALSRAFEESLNRKVLLSQAEAAYWSLAAARRGAAIAAESLGRAEKLRDWVADRVKRSLVDRAELTEAEAVVRLRALEARAADDERRAAERAFARLRGGETASEILDALDDDGATPRRAAVTDDVAAAEHGAGAAAGAADLGVEKTRPKVEAYASGALNGRDAGASPAVSDSFGGTGPSWTAGARVSVPLDWSLLSGVSQGHRLEAQAARKRAARAAYDSAEGWSDLAERLADARRRAELARDIEDAQKARVEAERERHAQGRTTTYFVLQAEQDWASARRVRVDAELQVRLARARMTPYAEL